MWEAIYLGKPLIIAREPKRALPSVRDGRDTTIEVELGIFDRDDTEKLFSRITAPGAWTHYFGVHLPALERRLFPSPAVAVSGPFHVESWVKNPVCDI